MDVPVRSGEPGAGPEGRTRNIQLAREPDVLNDRHRSALFDVEKSPRYRLAMLARLWMNSTEKIYEQRFGVTLSEWRIIAIVGTEQPINAGAIADRGLLEKSHISRLVARLVKRGILASRIDAADARKSWLTLTDEGMAVYNDIAAISSERDREFIQPLNADERAAFEMIVKKLIENAPRLLGGSANQR